jgi:hypothetical protein
MGPLSYSVCTRQAFPDQCNVKLLIIVPIDKIRRK